MYEVGKPQPGVFGTNVLLNAERHVAVHHVVEVRADRQALTAEAENLLHSEIPLPDALAVLIALAAAG